MTKLTKIDYLYRDASNYKFHGSFIVRGLISRKKLEPFLFDGEFFIPTMIGLPHLLNMASNDDDHDFHELSDFAEVKTGTADFDAADLLARFKQAHERNWSPPVFQYGAITGCYRTAKLTASALEQAHNRKIKMRSRYLDAV